MLSDYWKEKDLKSGETWLSFAQRTGMDAVSIAYGQAWQDYIEINNKVIDDVNPQRPWERPAIR